MKRAALVLVVALSGAGLTAGTPGMACLKARTGHLLDGGDIVMVDGIAGTRRHITRRTPPNGKAA